MKGVLIVFRTAPYTAPVLLAIVPLATLLANNIESVAPHHAVRPLLATLVAAALVIAVCKALLRDRERSVVVASLVLLLSSAGTIGEAIRAQAPGTWAAAAAAMLRLLWMGLLLGATVIILRRPRPPKDMAFILFAVSLPMLLIPAQTIVRHELALPQPYPTSQEGVHAARPPVAPLPDVWYIILDGYGREDVLADLYRIDSVEFTDSLKRLGFFVANRSLANYSQTNLSLASSLNMMYLDEVASELGENNPDHRPINRLIRHNQVRQTLEDLGYRVYAFPTGYRKTEWEDADSFLAPASRAASAFEALYLNVLGLTPATRWLVSRGWLDEMPGYAAHRSRILFAFEQAALLDSAAGPKFVFLHVILPHPPFVFDAQGSPVKSIEPFQMGDGTEFRGSSAEYLEGYSAQADFAGRLTLRLVEGLIDEATRPVVILIQADHGPGSRLDWDIPERSDMRERMGILNAYYAPSAEPALYPSITPVNSFRIIFNRYLGLDLALLPDHSYFSNLRSPYRFLEYHPNPWDVRRGSLSMRMAPGSRVTARFPKGLRLPFPPHPASVASRSRLP